MKKHLAYYENEWPANIAELTAVENKPFVGYLKGEGVLYTVIPEPVVGPADNEIWYTSIDGNVVTPYNTDAFGANIVDNSYKNGKGVITFDGDVTIIGMQAFNYCTSLTSVTIPNSVTDIVYSSFFRCSSLTSVTIPNSVTSIGDDAFEDCSSLTSITIPNSVTSIGSSAFLNCSSLTSLTIPNSVMWIQEKAFEDCSSLTSITIPSGVVSIGNEAFRNCSALTSVTIGDSVTNIRSSAFNYCCNLTSIIYEGTQEQWNNITKGSSWNYAVPATYVQCTDGQVPLQ